MLIFPDLPDIEVEALEVAEEITLTLRTASPTAACPSCGTASSRIQSRLTRTLRDLPSLGHPLRLLIHARRFFCGESACTQKIFVERLPKLCHPHAQRTKRLQEALRQLGLALGGQAGADAGRAHWASAEAEIASCACFADCPRLYLQSHTVSGLTIGRGNGGFATARSSATRERNQPSDLLPDRDVSTLEAWLEQHPSVRVVSRDGSSESASAMRKGAPQARAA